MIYTLPPIAYGAIGAFGIYIGGVHHKLPSILPDGAFNTITAAYPSVVPMVTGAFLATYPRLYAHECGHALAINLLYRNVKSTWPTATLRLKANDCISYQQFKGHNWVRYETRLGTSIRKTVVRLNPEFDVPNAPKTTQEIKSDEREISGVESKSVRSSEEHDISTRKSYPIPKFYRKTTNVNVPLLPSDLGSRLLPETRALLVASAGRLVDLTIATGSALGAWNLLGSSEFSKLATVLATCSLGVSTLIALEATGPRQTCGDDAIAQALGNIDVLEQVSQRLARNRIARVIFNNRLSHFIASKTSGVYSEQSSPWRSTLNRAFSVMPVVGASLLITQLYHNCIST
jgi:hypothetical protein